MKALDSRLLKKFLDQAGDLLVGDWVLIGGTVLPALGVDFRATTDIDLVGLSAEQMTQTLTLMKLAEKLGLPIETINQAGAYFFEKIVKEEGDLILLHRGKNAQIFRPSPTLYLLLKITRMSESDFSDCEQMLKYAHQYSESVDRDRIAKAVSSLKKGSSVDHDKVLRWDQLLKAI